jgi:hypothetical protein
MRRGGRTLALLALLATACGPEAAIWLRVEAPLRVPEDADALTVEVRKGAVDGGVSFSERFALSGQRFPATLTLTAPTADQLGTFFVSASALKGAALAQPWSTATGTVELTKGRVSELTLKLCACVP